MVDILFHTVAALHFRPGLLESVKSLSALNKQQKSLQNDLEQCKAEEQEIQDKINEDAKDLEKVSTKLSSLLKKVGICLRFTL